MILSSPSPLRAGSDRAGRRAGACAPSGTCWPVQIRWLHRSIALRSAAPTFTRSPTSPGSSSRASTSACRWSSLSQTETSCSAFSTGRTPPRRGWARGRGGGPPPTFRRSRASFACSLLVSATLSRPTWPRRAASCARTRDRRSWANEPDAEWAPSRSARSEPGSSAKTASSSISTAPLAAAASLRIRISNAPGSGDRNLGPGPDRLWSSLAAGRRRRAANCCLGVGQKGGNT